MVVSPTHRSCSIRAGFSLVELLIVIAILSILAAIVVPRFTTTSDTARNNSVDRQLQLLRSQLEYYESRELIYPPSVVAGTGWNDMTSRGYLKIEPRNALLNNTSTVSAGPPIAAGAAVPGGAAWYWDTTQNVLYAADADGNRLDF